MSSDFPTGVPKEGTDVGALDKGYASVTPLQLDLTAYHALTFLADWDWAPPAAISADPVDNGRTPIDIEPVDVGTVTA